MKVLILGSTGLLGNTLNLFLKEKKIQPFYISGNKSSNRNYYLKNFNNFKKIEKLIIKIKPQHIINCIGVTHHHKSYKNKKTTKLINSFLPKFLSKLCNRNKIYFLHISTDCVFSGKKGNYSEKSKKNPVGFYGKTKSNGEVKNFYSSTIRTSFIGPEKNGKNQLLNWFLSQKNEIYGFDKAFFSGLTSLELSKIIYFYFLKKKSFYNQILNIGGPKISKYKLLILFSKIFKKKIFIRKDTAFKIDRSLNSDKFKLLSKYKKKNWIIMIKDLRRFMINYNFKF